MANGFMDFLGKYGGDLLEVGGEYYMGKQGADAARGAGEAGLARGSAIGQAAQEASGFKPYTVTSSLATGTTTPEGGLNINLSPEEQARQEARLAQAEGLFGRVGVDPSQRQGELLEQIRLAQRPEEERERMRMQEGLFSRGRAGLSQSQFGGGSPEQLAFETAQAEARNKASLQAYDLANREQQQALNMAGQLTGYGYNPQQQALSLFAGGNLPAQLAAQGRTSGAQLGATGSLAGLEGFMQGEQLANYLEQIQMRGMMDAGVGSRNEEGVVTGGFLRDVLGGLTGNTIFDTGTGGRGIADGIDPDYLSSFFSNGEYTGNKDTSQINLSDMSATLPKDKYFDPIDGGVSLDNYFKNYGA